MEVFQATTPEGKSTKTFTVNAVNLHDTWELVKLFTHSDASTEATFELLEVA